MSQDINLYQDILIDKPAPFPFSMAVKVIFLVVVVAGSACGYSYWRTSNALSHLDSARQHEVDKRAQVAELQAQFPERQPNPLMTEKIEHLEQQLIGQKEALSFFANQQGTANDFILRSLQGLAHKQVTGLWLTRVALADQGQQVTLAGSALNELKIPEFVALLGENHVFGGAVFDGLTIARSAESKQAVNFILSADGSK